MRNPEYDATCVFTNDFSALLPDAPDAQDGQPLLRQQSQQGTCRVVCFLPRHDLSLPEMPVRDVRRVVDAWTGEVAELGERCRWVQVSENKGQ